MVAVTHAGGAAGGGMPLVVPIVSRCMTPPLSPPPLSWWLSPLAGGGASASLWKGGNAATGAPLTRCRRRRATVPVTRTVAWRGLRGAARPEGRHDAPATSDDDAARGEDIVSNVAARGKKTFSVYLVFFSKEREERKMSASRAVKAAPMCATARREDALRPRGSACTGAEVAARFISLYVSDAMVSRSRSRAGVPLLQTSNNGIKET